MNFKISISSLYHFLSQQCFIFLTDPLLSPQPRALPNKLEEDAHTLHPPSELSVASSYHIVTYTHRKATMPSSRSQKKKKERKWK